ncbi:hypothetical protein [Pseudomonas farris]|jgi:hypothetical protein
MRITPVLLAIVLTGCASPPQLSYGAKTIIDRPMPTSETERIRECAGTTSMVRSMEMLYDMQAKPRNSGGSIWAINARAKRLNCTQAEMDAPNLGRW